MYSARFSSVLLIFFSGRLVRYSLPSVSGSSVVAEAGVAQTFDLVDLHLEALHSLAEQLWKPCLKLSEDSTLTAKSCEGQVRRL